MRSTLILLALALAGCGNDNASAPDMSAPVDLSTGADMFLLSRCGHFGDTGNSLGVGQFCTNNGPDCSGNSKAKSCSAIANGQTPSANDSYFCTMFCSSTDPPGTCGENARCVCNAQGCICINVRCITTDAGT